MQSIDLINAVTATQRGKDGFIFGDSEEIVPLEQRLIKVFAETAVRTEVNKENVINKMESKVNLAPEYLIQVQEEVMNNNIEVSFISTVARKVIGTVETLLRS